MGPRNAGILLILPFVFFFFFPVLPSLSLMLASLCSVVRYDHDFSLSRIGCRDMEGTIPQIFSQSQLIQVYGAASSCSRSVVYDVPGWNACGTFESVLLSKVRNHAG